MSKKNRGNSIVLAPANPVAGVDMQPPVSAAEALYAMAVALSERRARDKDRILTERAKARAAFDKACRKQFGAVLRKAPVEVRFAWGDVADEIKIEQQCSVYITEFPELVRLRDAYKAAKAVEIPELDPERIVKELRAAQRANRPDPADRCAAILSAPGVRKKLAEAAAKMLATPTAEDKAKAIEVVPA